MHRLHHPVLWLTAAMVIAASALGVSYGQSRGGMSRSFNTYSAPSYSAPRYTPPRPMMPSQVMTPRAPQMAPRMPQAQFNNSSRGPTMAPGSTSGVRVARPLPLPPSIRQGSAIAQLPSYTRRVTITGAPIVTSRAGATYSVPQQGTFSTRIVTTFRPIRVALIQKYGSGRVVVMQQRLVRVATSTKIITAKIGERAAGIAGGDRSGGGSGGNGNGNTLAANDNRIRHVSTSSGQKGAWNKELNSPKPNTLYIVDNNYRYQTDGSRRVVRVEATLTLNKKDRNPYQQCKAGKCGNLGDEGGHLIATMMGGAGERLNLSPMDGSLNKREWRAMEREWADALSHGKSVAVKIQPIYVDSVDKRPKSFEVEYRIDDGNAQSAAFLNAPGEAK